MRKISMGQAIVLATELGFALAVSVLIGTVGGMVLDSRLENGLPIFTIVGSLVGLAAGVYAMMRMVQALTNPGE